MSAIFRNARVWEKWPQVNWENPSQQHRKEINQAIGFFFSKGATFRNVYGVSEPVQIQNFRTMQQNCFSLGGLKDKSLKVHEIQNLTTSSNFPSLIDNVVQRLYDRPMYDENWKAIYNTIPLDRTHMAVYTQQGDDYPVRLIRAGDSIVYGGDSGTRYLVGAEYYGKGKGIDNRAIDDKDWFNVEQSLADLRDRMFLKIALVHYGLIEAVSAAQNIAWQTTGVANDSPEYIATRDSLTIYEAINNLIAKNKDKATMPMGLNTPFIILYPYQLQRRIRQALGLRLQAFADSPGYLDYNIVPISTTLLTASDTYYTLIPKGKFNSGEFFAPRQFIKFNQDNYMQMVADWMCFAADLGDEEQVQRCATA